MSTRFLMKVAVGESAPGGGGEPNTSNIASRLLVPGGKGSGETPPGSAAAKLRTRPKTAALGSNTCPPAIASSSVAQVPSLWALMSGSLVKNVPSYRKTPENSPGARFTVASAAFDPAEKPPTTGFLRG